MERKSSLSSSTASSKVSPPVGKRRKLDVVAGRAATGVNARALTQMPTTSRSQESSDSGGDSRSQESSDSECDRMLLGHLSLSVALLLATVSKFGKRKAYENNVMASLVETLSAANKAIAEEAERKESWSIEKVIDVLNSFDDLGEMTFNLALRHFQDEDNRRIFMHLTPVEQRNYISFNVST